MRKTLSILFALFVVIARPASGKEQKLVSDHLAVATITIPDAWKSKAIDDGLEAESPGKAKYLRAVVVGSDNARDAKLKHAFQALIEHNIRFDETDVDSEYGTLKGMKALELRYPGESENGLHAIIHVWLCTRGKRTIIVTAAAVFKPGELTKAEDELLQVVSTLTPISH